MIDRGSCTTVVLADAHPRYSAGLTRAIALHPALELVGVADNGYAAVALILKRTPDLAVLDVRLPRLDGFEVSDQLRRSVPRPRTFPVLLTAVPDRGHLQRSRDVGALGCLAKDATRTEICTALLHLLRAARSASP